MSIQIFGTTKCFDTKKAQRWFKERRIPVQFIDLTRYPMSGGEFDNVLRAVGGLDNLINPEAKGAEADLLRYLAEESAREDQVFQNQKLIRTPVVRNGKKAAVGYAPETWEAWL